MFLCACHVFAVKPRNETTLPTTPFVPIVLETVEQTSDVVERRAVHVVCRLSFRQIVRIP